MKLRHSLLLGSALLAAATTATHAQTKWEGDVGSSWGSTGNWSTGVIPTGSVDVLFDSTATGNYINALGGSARAVKTITFDSATSYEIRLYNSIGDTTARSLTTGNITVSSGNHSIVGAKPGTGFTGSLLLSSAAFNIASGSTLTFDARLRQSASGQSYSKTGLGTLVLNADNGGGNAWGFTEFTVSQGVLQFAAANAFGLSSNKYTVSSGAALEITGGISQSISTGAGTINLNGTGIGNNGALRSLSGNNSLNVTSGTGGVVLASDSSIGVDSSSTLTINQVVSGAAGNDLTKVGAGTLTLTGANTYSGSTTISVGTLALSGAATIGSTPLIQINSSTTLSVTGLTAPAFTIGTAQTVGGNGTILATGKTVVASGTLSPGNSPGTLTQDGGALQLDGANGNLNWQVFDAGGTAGVGGYDTVNLINGATLDLSQLSALNPYDINLWSLSAISPADVNGNAINFNNTQSYTWTLFSTGTVITGFDASYFDISTAAINGTSGFTNALGGGSFSVGLSLDNTDLVLNFTSVPESRAALLGGLGLLALLRRRRN